MPQIPNIILCLGWLARKLKCVTKTGTLLDSMADIGYVYPKNLE